ncbi:UPF0449 protein C19orf25 homolog [Bufo bufo]|uniref:UPF0449 protein C19orf25 homolog n=1 Tax=Bufo bufo TaxID=8384 RepID=UPI001ABE95B4|nr:UPF0449 protein C19orf25 homolog [Bufo bufo]XP_040273522.1 UPF0449 protein C19orf25 homolog [Bufo bufo]XP_040273523.1 UPF0449 protein C19orf25 homolog [Bufo bufo]XP_040273524.1 UPF0449 protein C19orf25 homolog [Bufo bufo]
MTSRAKKRIVLPSRPEPPHVDEILEDVRGAVTTDPVFVCDLNDDSSIPSQESTDDREKQYTQSCSYVQLNNKLKETQVELKQKFESLRSSGLKLGKVIEELREAAM